ANCRNSCTARCWSIWYRFFIATLSFFLAEKLTSVIMTGVESRYFLRTNGHPLILFDTCVLKTHRLSEFPFLVRSFGFHGTLELLSSDVLEIMWRPFTIAIDFHRGGKRALPLFHFDCGTVKMADPEEHIHRCFQPFHE